MKKKLEDMSLQELWQLFPIVLSPHQPVWESQFENEKNYLESILESSRIRWIEQIGSTAIKTICSKSSVDILIELKEGVSLDEFLEPLINAGYIVMSKNTHRISLNKGYTSEGYAEAVFHVHLRCFGDHDELYFRDYLIEFSNEAKVYEALKRELAQKHKYHRDNYTSQKTTYVQEITSKAKSYYGKKYER